MIYPIQPTIDSAGKALNPFWVLVSSLGVFSEAMFQFMSYVDDVPPDDLGETEIIW